MKNAEPYPLCYITIWKQKRSRRSCSKNKIFIDKKIECSRFRFEHSIMIRIFITHCILTRASCLTKVKAPTAQMRVEALDWSEWEDLVSQLDAGRAHRGRNSHLGCCSVPLQLQILSHFLQKEKFQTANAIWNFGRSERIWTSGLLVPNQALYQTEPHPEKNI